MQPGHQGTVTAISPDGTMTVEIDGPPRRHRHVRGRAHPRQPAAAGSCGGRRLELTRRAATMAASPSPASQIASRTPSSPVGVRPSGRTAAPAAVERVGRRLEVDDQRSLTAACTSTTSQPQFTAPTARRAPRIHGRTAGTRPAHQATASTRHGTTTTTCRPGHHQPCIVRAHPGRGGPSGRQRQHERQPPRRPAAGERGQRGDRQQVAGHPGGQAEPAVEQQARRGAACARPGRGRAHDGQLAPGEVVARRVHRPPAVEHPVGDEVPDAQHGEAPRAGHRRRGAAARPRAPRRPRPPGRRPRARTSPPATAAPRPRRPATARSIGRRRPVTRGDGDRDGQGGGELGVHLRPVGRDGAPPRRTPARSARRRRAARRTGGAAVHTSRPASSPGERRPAWPWPPPTPRGPSARPAARGATGRAG